MLGVKRGYEDFTSYDLVNFTSGEIVKNDERTRKAILDHLILIP